MNQNEYHLIFILNILIICGTLYLLYNLYIIFRYFEYYFKFISVRRTKQIHDKYTEILKYKYTLTKTVEAEAYFAYLCNVNKVLSMTFQKKEKCTYTPYS